MVKFAKDNYYQIIAQYSGQFNIFTCRKAACFRRLITTE